MSDLSELQQRVVDVMVEKMHMASPPLEADLFETGFLDSLSFVSLLVHIEEEFSIQIDLKDLDLSRFQSVASIAVYIAGSKQPQSHAENGMAEEFLLSNVSLGFAG